MKTRTVCAALAAISVASAFADEPKAGECKARLPIIGWGTFSEKNASAERYREAKEAGFTHLTQWCTSPAEARRLLSEAEKAGVPRLQQRASRDVRTPQPRL